MIGDDLARFALPGDGHTSTPTGQLADAPDPRLARLELTIRVSAEAVKEAVRRRKRIQPLGGGKRTNTRIPLLADVRRDAQRVLSLIEAWAAITGNDGAEVTGPLARVAERRLVAIAKNHLNLDISELVGY